MTTCDRCNRETRAYVEKHQNDRVVQTLCQHCDDVELQTIYQQTGKLSSRLMTNIALNVYERSEWVNRVQSQIDLMNAAVADFEREVWYGGGLQSYAQRSDTKGHTMKTPSVQASLYVIMGRVLVTFKNTEGAFVTVITAEDEHRQNTMGVQGIDATAGEAITMLRLFTDYVRKNGLAFTEDNTLRIM